MINSISFSTVLAAGADGADHCVKANNMLPGVSLEDFAQSLRNNEGVVEYVLNSTSTSYIVYTKVKHVVSWSIRHDK